MNRAFFTILVLATVFSNNANACSCIHPINANFHDYSQEVFVGKVLNRKSEKFNDREFVFNVTNKVRGELPDKLVIKSSYFGASCGTDYVVGEEYLVVIQRKNEEIYSGLCSSWSMSSELGKTVFEFLTILNEVADPPNKVKN